MKRFAFAALALLVALTVADPALARRSSSGHSGSHSKNPSGYITRTCKTDACRKKHPGGHYSTPVGGKKRKQ